MTTDQCVADPAVQCRAQSQLGHWYWLQHLMMMMRPVLLYLMTIALSYTAETNRPSELRSIRGQSTGRQHQRGICTYKRDNTCVRPVRKSVSPFVTLNFKNHWWGGEKYLAKNIFSINIFSFTKNIFAKNISKLMGWKIFSQKYFLHSCWKGKKKYFRQKYFRQKRKGKRKKIFLLKIKNTFQKCFLEIF